MKSEPAKAAPRVEVLPASAGQQPILANLLELYLHDFSEILDLELGDDGRFGYKDLSLYWQEPGRHPFLLKVDGKLAGFAFVKQVPGEATWDMAEFFVARGQRRRGVGLQAAHEVWRQFPGRWQVRVMESNHSAHEFWQRAIAAFAREKIHSVCFEKDGWGWRVFSFESNPGEASVRSS